MITLEYTAGSPFARAIRVLLHELELNFERSEAVMSPSPRQLGADTPTMQVPVLRDGDVVLWESGVIADYLLSKASKSSERPLRVAASLWRPAHEWQDKVLFSTIQTLGTAVTTISQLTWTGVSVRENAHLQRCAERAQQILSWLEDHLPDEHNGFMPDAISAQDIFLACHVRFTQARPLHVVFDLERLPKCNALLRRLDRRRSLIDNPILWWDPEVIGYSSDGRPIYEQRD